MYCVTIHWDARLRCEMEVKEWVQYIYSTNNSNVDPAVLYTAVWVEQ